MDELDFDFHLKRHKDLLGVANEETRAGAMARALEEHQLAVRVELSKFTDQVLITARKLANTKAQQYMMYGVGRRLRMMLIAYCGVFDTIAPDRMEPLPIADMAAVSRDLNVIYINIRGALDNYAWCIYHEWAMGKTGKFKDEQVGLFLKQFRNAPHLKDLNPMLELQKGWNAELKSRRDPSAHRMPLYVPAALLTEAEAARHEEIWQERMEAIRASELDRDTELANEQARLGKFRSYFLHDPDSEGFPIYPTVATDVGKLIAIGTAIHDYLQAPPAGPPVL